MDADGADDFFVRVDLRGEDESLFATDGFNKEGVHEERVVDIAGTI